jgi:hypothetical protein
MDNDQVPYPSSQDNYAIENYKCFATFLNHIDDLNLTGTIDKSVGKSYGQLSAHAMVSVNRSNFTQCWPNKM